MNAIREMRVKIRGRSALAQITIVGNALRQGAAYLGVRERDEAPEGC